jgi:hypothetical protein
MSALDKANEENSILRQRIQELELKISNIEHNQPLDAPPLSSRRSALETAKLTDSIVNN